MAFSTTPPGGHYHLASFCLQLSRRFFLIFQLHPLSPDASGSGSAPEVPRYPGAPLSMKKEEKRRGEGGSVGSPSGLGAVLPELFSHSPNPPSLRRKAASFQLRDPVETINLARNAIASQLEKGRLGERGSVFITVLSFRLLLRLSRWMAGVFLCMNLCLRNGCFPLV